MLTIQPSSPPDLVGTAADNDIFWRIELTVTDARGDSTYAFFQIAYQSSSLTLTLSTTCQVPGQSTSMICQLQAANGLAATEPT